MAKTCSSCCLVKDLEAFPKNKASPDGHYSKCKACRAITAKANRERSDVKARDKIRLAKRYQANRETLLAKRKERYAKDPQAALAKNREWRDANLEKHRALCRAWAKNNPEAARALVANRRAAVARVGGRYTSLDIRALMVLQDGFCNACKCDLEVSGFHVDHIHPVSKGGVNAWGNLQLLCPTCNWSKSDKTPEEWEAYRDAR